MALGDSPEPERCALVIFGGSGDLARRKIAPALCGLARAGALPQNTVIVGFARSGFSDDAFRAHLLGNMERDERDRLAARVFYHRGDYDDPASFRALRNRLSDLDSRFKIGGARIFYLAVPPHLTLGVLQNLSASGLVERRRPGSGQGASTRVVLEKPFGLDLASAQRLNQIVDNMLDESQVFRMDHYLGKETVQNLLVLRFANSIFEPVWNGRHVRHVHVTVAETIGVAGRAGHFETTGALRDTMQNHVLQLLALFVMEPPASLDADAVRDEKVKVLRCLRRLEGREFTCSLARGQYGAGGVAGERAVAYRDEEGVAPDSTTETFVGLRTYIDNARWSGVPFYLTTGKRLARHLTEVAIEFREPHDALFRAAGEARTGTNLLKVRIQPDESVSLRIYSKTPGLRMKIEPAEMEFPCGAVHGAASPEAYERLLLDVMTGNQTLFARSDEIEAAWQFVDPILRHWASAPPPAFPNYAAGTWGPVSGKDFFREDTCYGSARQNP